MKNNTQTFNNANSEFKSAKVQISPEKIDKLNALKKDTDAVILAHYYAIPEVQAVADYIGDSYYLATLARELPNKVIVLAGVYFMAESAKILNPEKTVLIPDYKAGCPMADMVQIFDVQKVKEQFKDNPDDLAVVCYVNSNADVKAVSDVCVTSSNAVKIVSQLPQKNIYFIPDKNLGRHIASKLPDKNFIFHPGFCCVHEGISPEQVVEKKKEFPNVKVLAHPECRPEVLALADFIGSTSGILEFTKTCDDNEFIIATEEGIVVQMQNANPNKKFHLVNEKQWCKQMKKNTVDKIIKSLENLKDGKETTDLRIGDYEYQNGQQNGDISKEISIESVHALNKMVELA